MNAIERLRAVLCAPDGTVSIHGSDGDRAIIHAALAELDALTPAPQVPGDMVLVPREPTGDMLDAMIEPWLRGAGTERECLVAGWKGALSAAPSAPALNEPFGNAEEFPLNEPSGDSGQLASLEQRARELLGDVIGQTADDIERLLRADGAYTIDLDYALKAIIAALSAQPPSETVAWPEKEQAAISELMAAQELSYPALVRQAVRLYQRDWMRRRDGETCTWSGDKQREREFSGAALANQQGVGGAQAECDRRGKLLADLYNCDEAQIPVALLRRISACLMGMDEPQPAGDVGRVCNRNCDCVGPCKMGVE